ncbi:MAG TPA: class III extradiol ring-cleavage dioxygenase, partial [Burkholderiales bacterium]|nr:class III extradiol ring-cleavage dioxygenase [Burkholderiales bacterium]
DHGAWVPLLFMYPSADVPVAQLSIQTHLGVQHHYALGCALAPLAEEGVLIVGSGSITHNLQEVFGGGPRPVAPEYVDAFRDWIAERLASEDVESLLDYRRRAPDAARAHPTEGHFVPLLFALGAAGSHARATRLHDEVTFGVIGMDAYAFGAPVVRPVATEGVGSAAGS